MRVTASSVKTRSGWKFDSDDEVYRNVASFVEALPAGLYSIDQAYPHDLTISTTEFSNTAKLIHSGGNIVITKIISVVDNFLQNAEKYSKMGISHKKGILLYGPPGSGKTQTLGAVAQHCFAKWGAVGLQVDHVGDRLLTALVEIRKVQAASIPIIILFEDLDSVAGDFDDSVLCEFFDGLSTQQNIVFLATTNYMEDLVGRLTRPGRFDTAIELPGFTREAADLLVQSRLKSLFENKSINQKQYSKLADDLKKALTRLYKKSKHVTPALIDKEIVAVIMPETQI